MWAEMATNYYFNANAPSYFQKLFATDAGYIPIPQRLIALVGNLLNLSAGTIPYFYTWSAIIFSGMLVGTFCLSQFRTLVRSDAVRFLTCIAILMVVDFETRTFINFTYFSAFFVAIVTALALVEDSKEIPRWAWFAPIFMVSKPAVLAALPAMILVALISKPRFRWITIAAAGLCIVQLAQMGISAKAGAMPFGLNETTLVSKIITTFMYFLGFLGGYVFGPTFHLGNYLLMFVGLVIVCASTIIVMKTKKRAGALIFVGFSLLLFNVLLNAFALSDSWNRDLGILRGLPIYRHIIVGFFGCVLVVCGLISALTAASIPAAPWRRNLGALLLIVWFLTSGWLFFAINISRDPTSPMTGNSQWQTMAEAIDSRVSPLCVPIDPWSKETSWLYQRNCGVLKPAPTWENGSVLLTELLWFEAAAPVAIADKTLVAAAVLVKPVSSKRSRVEVQMVINLVDGSIKQYSGAQDINPSGGLLLLTGADRIAINTISSVNLTFNLPVEIALGPGDPAGIPGIAWMGN